jgi:hypothetical protein
MTHISTLVIGNSGICEWEHAITTYKIKVQDYTKAYMGEVGKMDEKSRKIMKIKAHFLDDSLGKFLRILGN